MTTDGGGSQKVTMRCASSDELMFLAFSSNTIQVFTSRWFDKVLQVQMFNINNFCLKNVEKHTKLAEVIH